MSDNVTSVSSFFGDSFAKTTDVLKAEFWVWRCDGDLFQNLETLLNLSFSPRKPCNIQYHCKNYFCTVFLMIFLEKKQIKKSIEIFVWTTKQLLLDSLLQEI